MGLEIHVKNGEAKTATFTIRRNGSLLDVSGATAVDFVVKEDYDDSSYKIEKDISDFDMSQAADGVISVVLTATDTAYSNVPNKKYKSELRITLLATDIDISEDIDFITERSLY